MSAARSRALPPRRSKAKTRASISVSERANARGGAAESERANRRERGMKRVCRKDVSDFFFSGGDDAGYIGARGITGLGPCRASGLVCTSRDTLIYMVLCACMCVGVLSRGVETVLCGVLLKDNGASRLLIVCHYGFHVEEF